MWDLKLWQEILLWIVVFIDVFIFVKLSQFRIGRFPLVKLHWRVLIAIIFPLIFVIAFVFGAFLLAIALAVLIIFFVISLFRRKKFNFRIRFF